MRANLPTCTESCPRRTECCINNGTRYKWPVWQGHKLAPDQISYRVVYSCLVLLLHEVLIASSAIITSTYRLPPMRYWNTSSENSSNLSPLQQNTANAMFCHNIGRLFHHSVGKNIHTCHLASSHMMHTFNSRQNRQVLRPNLAQTERHCYPLYRTLLQKDWVQLNLNTTNHLIYN